jgi:mannose-6-phosphate isomerase-like protein (cupin superfamily)
MLKPLLAFLPLAFLATAACAQTPGQAQVFPASQIHAELARLASAAQTAGSSGTTLANFGSHALMLSVRGVTGNAEIHAHFDDVMVVTGGHATLVTGGAVIGPTTEANGETKGSGIRGGVSRDVAEGDIVHVPAGTPHQLIVPAGVVFSAFVVKVRE